MSNDNYWTRSGSYVFLQRIAIFIFGFGSYFFLVRYYSKENFGVWALFIVVTSIVEMSRSAFIQNAFVKFYSEHNMNRQELVTASLFLNAISVLFFIVVMLLMIPILKEFWHSSEIGSLIFWYCLTSLILVPFTQINYIEQACNSFKGIFWSAVTRQGLFFGTVTVAFFFIPGLSLTHFAAIQCFCALVGLAVAWKLSAVHLPSSFVFHWPMVTRLFHFGKYILGTGVTSSIGKNTDQALLGSLSHEAVALYNAAIRIINLIEIPTYSISNVVYPKIAERVNREGSSAACGIYEKSVTYMVAIILPVILFIGILPEFVLLITAGKNYTEAARILQIIVASAILFPFNVQVGSAYEVIGKPHVSFALNMGANLLNLVLNILLVFQFGVMGAAWTTVITATSLFLVSQWLLHRELGVSLLRIVGQIPNAYGVIINELYKKIGKPR